MREDEWLLWAGVSRFATAAACQLVYELDHRDPFGIEWGSMWEYFEADEVWAGWWRYGYVAIALAYPARFDVISAAVPRGGGWGPFPPRSEVAP